MTTRTPCISWSVHDLNMTPKRIEALRWIKNNPGWYVSSLAEAVLTSQYRKEHMYGFSAQMATRAGAGCVVPLIKVGLVKKDRTEHGWGKVTLTEEGVRFLETVDAVEAAGKETV